MVMRVKWLELECLCRFFEDFQSTNHSTDDGILHITVQYLYMNMYVCMRSFIIRFVMIWLCVCVVSRGFYCVIQFALHRYHYQTFSEQLELLLTHRASFEVSQNKNSTTVEMQIEYPKYENANGIHSIFG